MYICDRCQKGLQVGMNVSHSHIRTKKKSLPNLHVLTIKINGKNKTMRLCTKCSRIVRSQFPYQASEAGMKEKASSAKTSKVEPKEEVQETVSN